MAIDLIRKEPPRLVITDLQMPVVDGFGVLEFIRSQRLEIATVVLSAFLSPEVERRVESYGASAILEKPIDLERLTNIVQGLLDSRSAGTPLADIVRMLHHEKRDVSVTVSTDSRVGVLSFSEGRLRAASIGELCGDLAVEEIVRLDRARLALTEGLTLEPSTTITTLELLTRLLHHAPRSTTSPTQQLARALVRAAAAATGMPAPSAPTARLPARAFIVPNGSRPSFPKSTADSSPSLNTNALEELMSLEGAIGACLVDWRSGVVLVSAGGEDCLSVDAGGSLHAQVVRTVMDAVEGLSIAGGVEDILMSDDDQYHLIRPLKNAPNAFVYFALDKVRGNAALARRKLQQIETNVTL